MAQIIVWAYCPRRPPRGQGHHYASMPGSGLTAVCRLQPKAVGQWMNCQINLTVYLTNIFKLFL